MQPRHTPFIVAAAALSLSTSASAATVASAITALNIRSGPGPEYTVIGAIPANGRATIVGCIQGSLWCQVSFNGQQGWAYSKYLTAQISGRSLVVAEDMNNIPNVSYQAPAATVGSAVSAPPVTGTLVESTATAAPLVITPPQTVRDYVISHPVEPVYLNGEVVAGVGLPTSVTLAPVPGYRYSYAYVNRVPVLVEPQTREVTYVYR